MRITEAVETGNLEVLGRLLNNDYLSRHFDLSRLLSIAANKAQVEVVKVLLQYGADIDGKPSGDSTQPRETPLHSAAEQGRIEMVKFLLELGANVNYKIMGDRTALLVAAEAGRAGVVKMLLGAGANIECRDDLLRTPLFYAALNGRVEAVETLLQHGANINAQDENGASPLHFAVCPGSVEVTEILLRNGADVNAVGNDFAKTTLHAAAIGGNVEIVEILLSCGMDVDVMYCSGETPLHEASSRGQAEVVQSLLQHGAKVNAEDGDDETPLHRAMQSIDGTTSIALLLEYGAHAPMECYHRLDTYCVETIERHFIKLEALAQVLGEPEKVTASTAKVAGWALHSQWDSQKKKKFLHECLQELVNLDAKIANTDFTYMDILREEESALRDLEVERSLAKDKLYNCTTFRPNQKFPLYEELIDIRYGFRHQQRQITLATLALSGKGDFSQLPVEVVEMICSFLYMRDIRQITRMFMFNEGQHDVDQCLDDSLSDELDSFSD